MICRFCGEDVDPDDLLHVLQCDGRQGAREDEAELHARGSDPSTSHEAMAAYDKQRMANAVAFVTDLYRRHGPMADYQLRDRFREEWTEPCCEHLYRQARSSARDKGLVHDTGTTVRNPETGRQQIVWAYCDEPAPLIHRCPTCGKLTRRSTLLVS
jgi:hypothetical protein